MGRRKPWGHNKPDLPKAEPLKGPVIGALLLGIPFNEEGVIAHGASSERWRLTDDFNCLLAPDDEFVVGNSLQEVLETLEARHPSPVPGVSLIEVCNDTDLKRHTMPFGDLAITRREKNPHHEKYHWEKRYVTNWLSDRVTTLERLCMGGNDLLISVEAEEHVRNDSDFDSSDLVIGKRDNWYSIVKYKPNKAAARRKTYDTIRRKEQKAADLVAAGRTLRTYAAEVYESLCEDMAKFEIGTVLANVPQANRYNHSQNGYDDADARRGVRYVRAVLRIHAAFLGKHAYRYNNVWQDFLKAVRERPKELEDDVWGNYHDVRAWLEAECKIRKPLPTVRMRMAQKAAEQAAIQARTCASCGTVVENAHELCDPPAGCKSTYATGAKLCSSCWGAAYSAVVADAEQPVVVEAS